MVCKTCQEYEEDRTRMLCENELAYAALATGSLVKGHTVVMPKRHVETISDLTDAESASMFKLVAKVIKILQNNNYPNFVIVTNEGPHKSVEHLHTHIVPSKLMARTSEIIRSLPDPKKLSRAELSQQAKEILCQNHE